MRDYRAEYRRRQERAKEAGYRSYAQQRKVRRQMKKLTRDEAIDIAESVMRIGYNDLADNPFEVIDESVFWSAFRERY